MTTSNKLRDTSLTLGAAAGVYTAKRKLYRQGAKYMSKKLPPKAKQVYFLANLLTRYGFN